MYILWFESYWGLQGIYSDLAYNKRVYGICSDLESY